MESDNPTGADNQQGSRSGAPLTPLLTPQRLHAELLAADAKGLEAYVQGALRDATRSDLHKTHRIGSADPRWLLTMQEILRLLGYRSWMYREGANRRYWVLETTARFLSVTLDAVAIVGTTTGLVYARGYFDADGGMPVHPKARLYFQYAQKKRDSLSAVAAILQRADIQTGRIHNPSKRVDPNYWRFYIRAVSYRDFMVRVGSWHPRKRQQMDTRMKI